MKKTKIRRPRINPAVRQAVTTLHLNNPDWTGEMIWRALEYYPKRQWPVPSLRATQKILAEVRIKTAGSEFQGKEDAWNLGTLENYPLPTEAIPIILKVQSRSKHFGKFTIRQAIWISRLYKVISDIALLDDISWNYTLRDKICQLSGTTFDTTKFDSLLKSPKKCLRALEYEFPRTKDAWYTKKAAFDAITAYTLNEAVYEIYFKGNKAWARRIFQPDILLGSRDEILGSLTEFGKKHRYWFKSLPYRVPTQIPDGDFSVKLAMPVLVNPKLEERSRNEYPEYQIDEDEIMTPDNKKLRGET